MAKIKRNLKGLANQRVRMGFFTVPLWVVGAVYLARYVKNRRTRVPAYLRPRRPRPPVEPSDAGGQASPVLVCRPRSI